MNKKAKPQEKSPQEIALMQKKAADLPALLEYAHSVGGFAIVPTQQGVIKGKAMSAMQEQTQEQLNRLYEQMKLMARQAQEIKDRVEISELIYQAEIRFQPDIGKIYYVYEKKDGSTTLSLIAPDEWGKTKRYSRCWAKVKLLSDHTWKIIEKFD